MSDLPKKDQLKSVSLDEAVNKSHANNFLHSMSPADKRENQKVQTAHRLAIGLWLLLGIIVVIHFGFVCCMSHGLLQADKEKVELGKLGVSQINETAKTLYTLLAPLATAITGYFFTSKTE